MPETLHVMRLGLFFSILSSSWASLAAQMVKNLPVMQQTRVQSLGWEDPLEKEMVTHSSTLARRIQWTEEPGKLQSIGLQESDTSEQQIHSLSQQFLGKHGDLCCLRS